MYTANVAPCGSSSTAKRPTEMSCAGTRVRPPRDVACRTVASTSGTATYMSQYGGVPVRRTSSGSRIRPPLGGPPMVHNR